jgi:hypothetical protein
MILVDSNVPMYLIGAEHPLKSRAVELLHRFTASRERLVTDVETFQEILHRYTAISRREAIQPAWDALNGVIDEVFPVDRDDLERAKQLVLNETGLSARDCLHLAVMERRGVSRILSFDQGFDLYPLVSRLY